MTPLVTTAELETLAEFALADAPAERGELSDLLEIVERELRVKGAASDRVYARDLKTLGSLRTKLQAALQREQS